MRLFVLFLILAFFLSTDLMAQFTGCYDGSNWIQNTANTNGTVFIQSGGLSMLADTDGNGNGGGSTLNCASGGAGNVSACIIVPFTGQFAFTWSWSGGSSSTFASEPFGYCLNGVPTTLTNGVGGGTESVNVASGDTFCFVVSSQLANSHPTLPTAIGVTNFTGPCPPGGCQAGFTYIASAMPDSILFTDNSVGTINSRTWYFGDGTTSNAVDPTHKYPSSGNYDVCLAINATGSCVDSICQTVMITTTTISESIGDDILIGLMPNPVSGNLNVLIDTDKIDDAVRINIYNSIGEVVYSEEFKITSNKLSLQTGFLPTGNYILQVVTNSQLLYRKFVKID